jgi:hypothetical protein
MCGVERSRRMKWSERRETERSEAVREVVGEDGDEQ